MKCMIAIAVAFVAVSCGATRREKERAMAAASSQVDVAQLAADINYEVQETAREITNVTKSREVRRIAIVWQIQTLEATRRALERPDARWAFTDLWVTVAATKSYLESDVGRQKLGDEVDVALEAVQRLSVGMRRQADRFLSPEQAQQLEEAVTRWVGENPNEGELKIDLGSSLTEEGGVLTTVMAIPQGIFSLGGGVKDTAAAASDVAAAANRGVSVVASMPLMMRWQSELLMQTIEENESVQALLTDISRVSTTIDEVSKTIDQTPDRIEQAALRAIREVESTQPEFRKTLAEGREIVAQARGIMSDARGTVAEVEPILARLEQHGAWVESATANAAEAGEAWEAAFEQLVLLKGPEPAVPEPAGPPLDMKDVAKTAEYATRTAEEIRAAVADLRAVLDGDGIDRRVARAEASAAMLIGRAAWAVAIVIVVFFAALLGYRVASVRLLR